MSKGSFKRRAKENQKEHKAHIEYIVRESSETKRRNAKK